MRYTDIDLQTEDIRWFAASSSGDKGEIFAFTSSGVGFVPEFVRESREENEMLEQFFLYELTETAQARAIQKLPDCDLRRESLLLSRKGIMCFDAFDGASVLAGSYQSITSPVNKPRCPRHELALLRTGDLPPQIRAIMEKRVLSPFAEHIFLDDYDYGNDYVDNEVMFFGAVPPEIDALSLLGRVACAIMCAERYLLAKYPGRDFRTAARIMWGMVNGSDWLDESAYRFGDIIPDVLFERMADGSLVKYDESDYVTADEVRALRATLPTPEDDSDFNVLMQMIYNIQLADVYSTPRLDRPQTGARLMKVLDILRKNGIASPDLSALPQDRNVQGGTGNWIDEQNYTLIVKGEAFPDRRKKHDTETGRRRL